MLKPNPRTISRELLARREFIPATTLNVLAAAWLQFEVHDWMSHGTNDVEDLRRRADLGPRRPMRGLGRNVKLSGYPKPWQLARGKRPP